MQVKTEYTSTIIITSRNRLLPSIQSFAAFSKPNLLRSLVWMKLKLENIRSIEAELAGRFSRRGAKSLNSGFTSLWLLLVHNHHYMGLYFRERSG